MKTGIMRQPILMKQNLFNKVQPKLNKLHSKIKLIENRKLENLKKSYVFLKKTAEEDLSFFDEMKEDLINEFCKENNDETTSLSTEVFLEDDDLDKEDIFVN